MKMVHNCTTNESYLEEIVGEELEALLASQAEGKVRADATIGAWVNFNQTGSIAIGTSYNVSSIADQAVGQTTVNFATDYSTAPCWSTDTDTVSITGHQYVAAGQIQILVKTHDNNFQDVQGCAVITVGEV